MCRHERLEYMLLSQAVHERWPYCNPTYNDDPCTSIHYTYNPIQTLHNKAYP